jgi:hypothetical protein
VAHIPPQGILGSKYDLLAIQHGIVLRSSRQDLLVRQARTWM